MISSVKFSGSDVIEDVCLPFSEGLNVITGETGTGKTVLINLLGYTLGFPLQIPFFLKKGQVEVHFSQGQEEYVVKLQLGGSRRTLELNSQRVGKKQLRTLFQNRVILSSQFDSKILESSEQILSVLDSFAGLGDLHNTYISVFGKLSEVDSSLRRLTEQLSQSAKVRESLQSELEELRAFGPKEGEYEELKSLLLKISEKEHITEARRQVVEILQEESPFYEGLKSLRAALSSLSTFYEDASTALRLVDELRRSLETLKSGSEELEVNQSNVDEINERLFKYEKYFRRYGFGESSIIGRIHQLEAELQQIDSLPDRLEELSKSREMLKSQLIAAGLELAKRRRNAVERALADMQMFLRETNVEGDFSWQWVPTENSSLGLEIPQIGMVRSGQFVPASALSGGEKNRLLLAFRVVFSFPNSVLIFDEPDAGLGGETLSRLVNLLKRVSENRQIILITHNPQVAAAAKSHFLVERILNDDKMRVKINLLQGQRRIHEVAKMIAGQYVTATTLELASELVNRLSGGEPFGEVYTGD